MINCNHLKEGEELQMAGTCGYLIEEYLFQKKIII